jgi:hypothetical protein
VAQQSPYRQPVPPPPPNQGPSKLVIGILIAAGLAIGIPMVMLAALFVLIVGVCGHWR